LGIIPFLPFPKKSQILLYPYRVGEYSVFTRIKGIMVPENPVSMVRNIGIIYHPGFDDLFSFFLSRFMGMPKK